MGDRAAAHHGIFKKPGVKWGISGVQQFGTEKTYHQASSPVYLPPSRDHLKGTHQTQLKVQGAHHLPGAQVEW